MSIAPFEYSLPPNKIASHPPRQRGASRLLHINRAARAITDDRYARLAELLQPNDLIILNDTRVIAARLEATMTDGRRRELFLSEKHATPLLSQTARVVHRGKLRAGDVLTIGREGIEVIEVFPGGEALIRATIPPLVLAERYGHTPLPPYIKRPDTKADHARYQTVFARRHGSVAAPTASLNLTEPLIKALRHKGITVAQLTLHVGRGTFLPIRTESIAEHTMHTEYYSIPPTTIRELRRALSEGRRIVAIGTTVTRALEHAAPAFSPGLAWGSPPGQTWGNKPAERIRGEADIFITPGYEFKIVGALLTNFHAPDSTVLQLAAAFAGTDLLEIAYQHALAGPYKFLSYGDSMLIE